MADGFEELGAEVTRFDTGWGIPRRPPVEERIVRRVCARKRSRQLEQELVETARRAQADLVLVFGTEWIGGDTLRSIRAAGTGVLASFWPDIRFYDEPAPLSAALGEFDLLITPKSFHLPRLRSIRGPDLTFLPYAADPRIHFPVELRPGDHERFGATIGFVGTWRDYREREIEQIAHHGIVIYGGYWLDRCRSSRLLPHIRGPIFGVDLARVYASSTLALNVLGQVGGVSDVHTSRSFEAPACGRPTLMARTTEHTEFFSPDEVVYFDGTEDLDRVISAALADSGILNEIGRRGADRIREQHLYRHRMAAVLDYLGLPRKPGPAWPKLESARNPKV